MDCRRILCHRGLWNKVEEQNTAKSFYAAFKLGFGIEIDLRDQGSKLVISHDRPLDRALLEFSDMLDIYKSNSQNRSYLALNIKSDGISEQIIHDLNTYEVINYFTFDMSIPEMICYKMQGIKYFSRVSEYEKDPILLDGASGIWLDAFTGDWFSNDDIQRINKKKQICFVSSELHGRDYKKQWVKISNFSKVIKFMLCTDKPIQAQEHFE